MRALRELTESGFLFWVDGDKVRYFYNGKQLDEEYVRPRIEYLRRHREEAVAFVRGIEEEAIDLLDREETMNPLQWCRQWADLATRAGWRSSGYDCWADWLADIVAAPLQTGVREARSGHPRELTDTDR